MNDGLVCDAELAANIDEAIADLQIKAMMFDMDIDIETWSLVPKNKYVEPIWITRWKEKEHGVDHDNRLDYDQE